MNWLGAFAALVGLPMYAMGFLFTWATFFELDLTKHDIFNILLLSLGMGFFGAIFALLYGEE